MGFHPTGGVWSQQGSIGTGGTAAGQQGYSVALSADGNTAVVGAPFDNSNAGAVWFFTRSSGVWTQQGAKMVATGGVGSPQLGKSVALSADGNTAIVGGDGDNFGVGGLGLYPQRRRVVPASSKLIGTGATGNALLGISVALSGDGNTAIAGGSFDASSFGAAWMFTRERSYGVRPAARQRSGS